jgi:hypothetical protein
MTVAAANIDVGGRPLMSAVVIPNSTEVDQPPPAPTHPDGHPYRFELIYAGGRLRGYADQPAALVEALSGQPGYPELDDPARYGVRLRAAVDAQVRLQAELNETHGLEGCTPEEAEVLTGARDVPPQLTEWSSGVPLVLVDGFYEPEGDLPRPTSTVADVADPPNLVWLRTSSDLELLESLHQAGYLQLHETSRG